MERRRQQERSSSRRRWRLVVLAMLAVVAACVVLAPRVLVHTGLRERPLERVFAGIDGSVASGSASWRWWGPVEYRNIVLRDSRGLAVVAIEHASLERGLLNLAWAMLLRSQPDLGRLRLSGVEVVTTIEPGGSSIERFFAGWTTAAADAPRPALEIDVVDAGLLFADVVHGDAWRVADVVASARLTETGIEGWTVAGHAMHAGRSLQAPDAIVTHERFRRRDGEAAASTRQVAAEATALVAREGGFSISSPVPARHDANVHQPVTLAVATHRLPLGISELMATRFGWQRMLDGYADMRLDMELPRAAATESVAPLGVRVRGRVTATQLVVLDAATLSEQFVIERVEMPLEGRIDAEYLTLRQLSADSPLFSLDAVGRLPLADVGSWDWLARAAREDFSVNAEIDLAAVARGSRGGLEIRPDVRVTDGRLRLAAASRADGGRRVVEMRVATDELEALQGERQLRWESPLSAWLQASHAAGEEELRIDEARVVAASTEITARTAGSTTQVDWTADLARLVGDVGEILDLSGTTLEGTARGSCRFSHGHAGGSTAATLSTSVDGLVVQLPGRTRLSDPQLQLQATGIGRLAGGRLVLEEGHALFEAGHDSAEITLTSAAVIGLDGLSTDPRILGFGQGPAAEVDLAGSIAAWQARLAAVMPAAGLSGTTLKGNGQVSAAVAAVGDAWQFTRAGGELTGVVVELPDGRSFDEPRVVGSLAGTIRPAAGGLEISSAEILTATVSLRSGGFSIQTPSGRRGTFLSRLRGGGQWQADVGRIERWLTTPLAAASWPASGRVWGTFEVLEAAQGLNVRVTATGNDLALANVPAAAVLGIGGPEVPREVWREPRATFLLEITHDATAPEGRLLVNALSLDSSTAAVQASGSVNDLSTRTFGELSGTIRYDWDALSRLVTPWTGGQLRLAGGGGRPFTIRGPLGMTPETMADGPRRPSGGLPVVEDASTPQRTRTEIPQDWLAAARGLDGGRPAATSAGSPLPVSLKNTSAAGQPSEWFRGISLETTIGWQAANLFGLPLEQGEVAVRLLDGQLAFGPFDLAASGGRLRGAPWLRLTPGPVELVVPPGRIVERLDVSQGIANRWMTWVAPLLGQSTQTSGRVSLDTAGCRMPLVDPFAGEASGQLLFEGLEVTPGPPAEPLVRLVSRLQGLLDPRLGAGDRVVLMRVRPEPVRVWLSGRRIWHDGLVMETGQLMVRTRGSVAADGTLAMDVEMAFRGDIVGQTPIVAALLRTPLLIPLKGTVDRPQFDAASIDRVFAKIAENTAGAVISDGIGRGLEALFGNPQPPAPPR